MAIQDEEKVLDNEERIIYATPVSSPSRRININIHLSKHDHKSLSLADDERKGLLDVLYNDLPIISNVSSAILGVSIFAMPWGYSQSGVLGGCILTILVALLSFLTSRVLLLTQKSIYMKTGEIKGFSDIASDVLGHSTWGTTVKVATAVSCLGGCVGYLIFLGQLYVYPCMSMSSIFVYYRLLYIYSKR